MPQRDLDLEREGQRLWRLLDEEQHSADWQWKQDGTDGAYGASHGAGKAIS